jgi:hypothetical protein
MVVQHAHAGTIPLQPLQSLAHWKRTQSCIRGDGVKRIAWWIVFACGLGGAYVFGQTMNARWYRQTPAHLDSSTTIEVFGDALADKCYAVARFYSINAAGAIAAVSLGEVPCRK